MLLLAFSAKAQKDSTLQTRKDIYDLIHWTFKPKGKHKRENTTKPPPRIFWTILPGFGYAQQKGFSGVCTNNASFLIVKDSSTNISSIDFILEYTQFNQFLFPIISSIWTKKNKFNILGDWRYLKYSTKAYGLGGRTANNASELIDYSFLRIYQVILKRFAPNLLAGGGFALDYRWAIKSDASNHGLINQELRDYGILENSTSSGITLNLLYDPRPNSNNPMEGSYANIVYRNSQISFGSSSNWSSLQIDFRKYITYPSHSRNVLAFWNYNWLTLSGKQPYFDLPGNGWDTKANIARQYRQGRFTAKNLLYAETEYRFELTRNGLLAGVVFVNILSVSNKNNTKFDPILPGAGGGIRLLTNKNSSTHLVLSYAVGANGAQGFSFNLGEAF